MVTQNVKSISGTHSPRETFPVSLSPFTLSSKEERMSYLTGGFYRMNSTCLAQGLLGSLAVLDASLPAERVQSALFTMSALWEGSNS